MNETRISQEQISDQQQPYNKRLALEGIVIVNDNKDVEEKGEELRFFGGTARPAERRIKKFMERESLLIRQGQLICKRK